VTAVPRGRISAAVEQCWSMQTMWQEDLQVVSPCVDRLYEVPVKAGAINILSLLLPAVGVRKRAPFYDTVTEFFTRCV
jgi:hypothetical protein